MSKSLSFGQLPPAPRYISTRGRSPSLDFLQAALAGLAPDGGLYVPESFPSFGPEFFEGLRGLSYAETAYRVMLPFVNGSLPEDELRRMIDESYASFAHSAVVPLKQLDERHWLLELFHGPTFAFKDVALQFLGRVLDYALTREDSHAVVIGATSGDTGSAAIEGCKVSSRVKVFILHPHEAVSAVQRRQMTTVEGENVHNVAVQGDFDACQDIVKALLKEQPFVPLGGPRLAAVNSVNWCRILAQVVYYVYAAVRLGAPNVKVAFSVPTGNFGDIYAGYVAHKMGLPVARLIAATNSNDILHRFFSRNSYVPGPLRKTLSPSMDIRAASNFERYLYDLLDQDGARVERLMLSSREAAGISLDDALWRGCGGLFGSDACTDEDTVRTMRAFAEKTGEYVDPHTAAGLYAALRSDLPASVPVVTLATAHRSKFPEASEAARYPESLPTPEPLRRVFEKEERFVVAPADTDVIRTFVAQRIG